jgi:hypothetical protein
VAVVAMHHFIIKFLGELTLQGYSCGGQQWNGRFLYRPSGCLFLRQLLKTSSGYLSVPSYQFWQNANASYTTRSIRVKKDAKKFTVHKDNIFLPTDSAVGPGKAGCANEGFIRFPRPNRTWTSSVTTLVRDFWKATRNSRRSSMDPRMTPN